MNDEKLQYISSEMFRIRMMLEQLVDELNDLESFIDEEIL